MLAAGGDGSRSAAGRGPSQVANGVAAAVSGPPAKSGGQVRRTAAMTVVIGLLRMSRLPWRWW
jgi:hypothetical protein